ncbi:MAG: radical SAM protein [Desulfobacteraceae bacterium]
MNPYRACRLCPRECGVDRTRVSAGSRAGVCGEGDRMRVAWVGPHFGEEPPITGENGSGTVFFTGCPLRCVFCQNYQISHGGLGEVVSVEALVERVLLMEKEARVHNVNFVSPDPFFPSVFEVVKGLRLRGCHLPAVFNLSGYQSVNLLRQAEEAPDIYLPDFKYSDARLAARYASCPDYPGTALDAIGEMLRQKGILDTIKSGKDTARKGVLVRHLILPGHVENSMDALSSLFVEFGADLPLSLMSQYRPVSEQLPGTLGRRLHQGEFDRVFAHAQELGFRRLFVQFPEKEGDGADSAPFLPDFRKKQPFKGRQE